MDITVTLLCRERFNQPLNEVIAELSALLAAVPPEYRDDVIFDLGDDGDYDGAQPELVIYYVRPETDGEAAERIARETALRESAIQIDIANARALLAKYGQK